VRSVPLTDAGARLRQLAEEVDRTREPLHLTKDGHEYVVLVSAQDLASMEATLELLSDPEAPERLRWAEAEVAPAMSWRRTSSGACTPGSAAVERSARRPRRLTQTLRLVTADVLAV
jgi:antitoxin YefM